MLIKAYYKLITVDILLFSDIQLKSDGKNSDKLQPEPEPPRVEEQSSACYTEESKPANDIINISDQPNTSPLGYNEKKPLTNVECLMLCKTLFEDKRVHNNFLCAQNFCSDISSNEKERLLPKRFNHNKLKDCWWLCFAEGECMYCLLCKKFDVKHALNKRDVFANTPSTRYIEDSLKTHSLSYVLKSAIQTELSQKTSVFHKDVCTKAKVMKRSSGLCIS